MKASFDILSRLGEMKVKTLNMNGFMVERLDLESEFWEALRRNYCIDELSIRESNGSLEKQEILFECLDIAGRRHLKLERFHPKLWPLFFDGANKKRYPHYDCKPLDGCIPSVIFHFVKHGLIQTLSAAN